MNGRSTTTSYPFIYYRLIAIWVLCEAMLGGIIHGFKIPISGLVVGSCAVICISLIAWYVPVKGAILKATLIVAIFKMMLSPQAPPPAFIAVFFQGLLGELLFWKRKHYRLSCGLLAVLALVESAIQRILVVTILYGTDFWTAVNGAINRLTGQQQLTDYSYYIMIWYIIFHIMTGVAVGVWAGFLPERIRLMKGFQKQYTVTGTAVSSLQLPLQSKKKKLRVFLFIIWMGLIGLYVQSFFKIGKPWLPQHISLRILIRSVIIVLTWYFLLSPLLKQLLHKWLQQKKQQSMRHIQPVLNLLPATQRLIRQSWQLAADRKGLKRVILCCKIILANTFYTADA